MRGLAVILLCLSSVCVSTRLSAAEWFVNATSGSDENDGLTTTSAVGTIQCAIDKASSSEVIHVAPGRYAPIDSEGKALTIVADQGPLETFIDGGGTNRCAELRGWYYDYPSRQYYRYDFSVDTILAEFTLENGFDSGLYAGGAGVCGGTLEQCIVRNCQAIGSSEANGAATYFGVLCNCLVYSNMVISAGNIYGGVCCATDLIGCTVADNSVEADGIVFGGGLYTYNIFGWACNSIIVGTSVSATTVVGENVYNTENITGYVKTRSGGDPKFVDRANGDYRLTVDSPCIDAGYSDQAVGLLDLEGNARVRGGAVDQGCYESAYTAPVPVVPKVTPTRGGRHYGIFVGINEFAKVSGLNGCIHDAEALRERCLRSGLWHAEDTVVLTNALATESAVRSALASCAAQARPGDTVLYTQSSHGGNGADEKMSAYLCMYDCDMESGSFDGYFRDTELAEELSKFPEGVRVIVYADACRSGGLFKSWESDVLDGDLTLLSTVAQVTEVATTPARWSFASRVRTSIEERSVPLCRISSVGADPRALSASQINVTSSVATNIAFITAADYDQYSWDDEVRTGGSFTLAFTDGWTNGCVSTTDDGKINFYELYAYAASIATGNWSYVKCRTEAQCDNAALLAATLAGYASGVWPEPEIASTDTPAEQMVKIQDAMVGAGFSVSTASAVTNTNQYERLIDWANECKLTTVEIASSPTALISAALDADALLSLTKDDLKLTELTPTSDGQWTMKLSLEAYNAAKASPELLKAAVGVVGSETPGGSYTKDNLTLSVSPAALAIEIKVTPPSDKNAYFLKSIVR